MATNKHRKRHYKKRHYKKGHQTQKRRRHYRKKHSNTSLKEYLSSDDRESYLLKETVINSDVSDTSDKDNNGNIIHGLRDMLSNKKKK
jgi:hypothetical protein